MNSADVQDAVATEVNSRLEKATADLQEKYARGRGGIEESVSAPTGSAYKEMYEKDKAKQNDIVKSRQTLKNQDAASQMEVDGEIDDNGGDEDHELRQIKEARLKQLKNAHKSKLENIGKGHGQFREVVQDEFISEVTSSRVVICQFHHREFPRSAIMSHHLQKLAQRHIESKFIQVNAEKVPFFVEKLKIRTMPTVVIFSDGVAADKIIGFDGLTDKMPEGKEDEWPTIVLARLLATKNAINSSSIVDDDEVEANMKAKMLDARRSGFINIQNLEDDDDDFDN